MIVVAGGTRWWSWGGHVCGYSSGDANRVFCDGAGLRGILRLDGCGWVEARECGSTPVD